MFFKAKFYSVFINPKSDEPLGELLIVSNSFNLWAFLISPIWALFNRVWVVFFIAIAIELIAASLIKLEVINYLQGNILTLVTYLIIGFEAGNFQEASLKNRGYTLFDIVYSKNEDDAKIRFIDKYNTNQLIQANKDLTTNSPSKSTSKGSFVFDDVGATNSSSPKSFA